MAAKYEDILRIDAFSGLNQSGDNLRMSFAADGYNFSVRHGGLKSIRKPSKCGIGISSEFEPEYTIQTGSDGTLDARNAIRMLGIISQRWKDGYSGAIPADTDWMITVLNGKIYARKNVGGNTRHFHGTDWIEVYDGGFESDIFDCVTYEINYAPPETFTTEMLVNVINNQADYYAFDAKDYTYYRLTGGDGYAYYQNLDNEEIRMTEGESVVRLGYSYPVDALVISNSKDGMYLIYAPPVGAGNDTILSVTPITIQPSGETHEMKFGCIARYAERIWGAGIDTDPDKLVYSAPYDIFNWEQNNNEPDDGAGDIQQPDWDGDRFTAVKPFGNQLVCFKKNSIWAITGTSPGAFYMRKQYGHGTIYEDSIAIYNGGMYFVTDTGLHSYDSINVSPVRYGYLKDVFDNFQTTYKKTVCGCECAGKYYFNLMTYDSGFNHDSFFCYDILEGTISAYRLGVYPLAFTEYDDSLFILTYDQNDQNMKWSVMEFDGSGSAELYYRTAWQDLGAKHIVKSEFEVYLLASVDMGDSVQMEVGIETEYKRKVKNVVLTSDRVKRIKLNTKGRKFRFWIKASEQTERWELTGGVQIAYSVDYD